MIPKALMCIVYCLSFSIFIKKFNTRSKCFDSFKRSSE